MNGREGSLRVRAAEKLFELLTLLVMEYTALAAASFWAELPLQLWLVLVLSALFGAVYAAGTLLGTRGIAVPVLLGSMVLACALLWRIDLPAEGIAASAGYLIALLVHSFPWPRRAFVLAAAGAAVLAFTQDCPIPPVYVAAWLLLALKELAAFYGDRFAVQLLPLCLAGALAALLIPAGEKPLDWSFVLRLGHSVVSAVRNTAQEVEYFFASPEGPGGILFGYGGNGEVGGALGGGAPKEELYLSAKCTRRSLYLEGEQYGVLEGEQWSPLSGGEQPYALWYAEFLNMLAHNGITPDEARTFAEVCSVRVTYGYLKTNDVLRPEHMLTLSTDANRMLTENPNDFTYRETARRGFQYELRFLDIDWANPYLKDLLQNGTPPAAEELLSYDALNEISKNDFQVMLSTVLSRTKYEAYLEARTAAESSGEEDPLISELLGETLAVDGVSDRMRELAGEITAGVRSEYDKAKAIETYLRQYPYDPSVDLRGTESFLDTFLFERQAGYCVHYASAMVMLLRLNGIPARLAEGYVCQYDTPRDRGGYSVLSSNAHLWPEAYLKGFGWVRFEPTPAMPAAESNGWGLRVTIVGVGPEQSAPKPTPEPPEQLLPLPDDAEAEAARIAAEEAALAAEAERRSRLLLLLIGLPVLAAALLLGLYLGERKLLYRFRGEQARLRANLEDLCWLIRRMYPAEWKNRPLLDHAAALEDPALRERAGSAFLLWYRLRYRGEPPAPGDWEELASVRRAVYEAYLDAAGRRRRRYQILAFMNCRAGF